MLEGNTWRPMGLSNFSSGLMTLPIGGMTYPRQLRETVSRVTSPVISSYEVSGPSK